MLARMGSKSTIHELNSAWGMASSMIERWGGFDTSFRISADFDAALPSFGKGLARAAYIPRVLVKMRVGAKSNRSLAKIWLKTREDFRALRKNEVGGVGALA